MLKAKYKVTYFENRAWEVIAEIEVVRERDIEKREWGGERERERGIYIYTMSSESAHY